MHPVIFKRNNYIGIRKTNHRTAHMNYTVTSSNRHWANLEASNFKATCFGT